MLICNFWKNPVKEHGTLHRIVDRIVIRSFSMRMSWYMTMCHLKLNGFNVNCGVFSWSWWQGTYRCDQSLWFTKFAHRSVLFSGLWLLSHILTAYSCSRRKDSCTRVTRVAAGIRIVAIFAGHVGSIYGSFQSPHCTLAALAALCWLLTRFGKRSPGLVPYFVYLKRTQNTRKSVEE